jgi:hypothetical protein
MRWAFGPAGAGRFARALRENKSVKEAKARQCQFPLNVVRVDCECCNRVASQTAGVAA